jgi:hypothetical protein
MPSYRYLTQDALTREVLAWNLPLTDVSYGPELSGPGSMTATLEPHLAQLLTSQADPGNTIIWAERDSKLMWGGVIWRAEPAGSKYPIEAAGFGSYPTRRHDVHGNLNGRGPYVNADPCTVIRDAWAYCQEQPDGDLGVTVDSTTSTVTIGTPAQPYATNWWEAPALSDVISDAVAVDGGPQWTEQVTWTDGQPTARIQIGWPRLGARRTDLSFATGINITTSTPVTYDADTYAQVVVALGSGEGRARQQAIDAVRDGRLRLEEVLDLPAVKGSDQLAARARTERTARQIHGAVEQITITDHPAAPFGSFQIGDDVQVSVHDQWTDYDGWCRITGWNLTPAADDQPEQMTLRLDRADRSTYGA